MQKYINYLILLFITINLYAIQSIEIVGGNKINLPQINIIDFTNDVAKQITDVVANDLNITGEFLVSNNELSIKDNPNDDPINNAIKQVTDKYTITGSLINNKIIYSLKKNNESNIILLNKTITNINNDKRIMAHTISNEVYKKITNINGIFTSKIAFITKNKNKYKLIIADYDGFNQKTIMTSNMPLSSIAWNQFNNQVSYVSFEDNKPVIYVQDLYKPNRYKLANFNGSNSSPTYDPTSSDILATLTKDDNGSHIYLLDNTIFNANAFAIPLINYGTIDTEASINKNGKIVFTSNHNGGPQIFLTSLNSKAAPQCLTTKISSYNTTARFAHDSNKITFISRNDNLLRVYIQDLDTTQFYPISSDTVHDISPSFAPNDKLILFSSDNVMYIANSLATKQTKLKNINSDGADTIIDQYWANS